MGIEEGKIWIKEEGRMAKERWFFLLEMLRL